MTDAFRYLNPNTREYSWIGKTGNGYRYDHFFVSNHMSEFIGKCFYDHLPQKKNLSDHSGVVLEIKSNI
jgi:exodeoxyribonuclease-3